MKNKHKNKLYYLTLIFIGLIMLGGIETKLEAYGIHSNFFSNIHSVNISSNTDGFERDEKLFKSDNNNSGLLEEINLCDLDVVVCPNEEVKKASWYDYTLNGIEWSKTHRTCASRDLPRYSTAIVTNIENNKSVECFINDFGPEAWTGRDIDLSSFAFSQIANLSLGLADVKIEQKL